jgi:hypothetical protein
VTLLAPPKRSQLAPRSWEASRVADKAAAPAVAAAPRRRNTFLTAKRWDINHRPDARAAFGGYASVADTCIQCGTITFDLLELNDGSPVCGTCWNEANF